VKVFSSLGKGRGEVEAEARPPLESQAQVWVKPREKSGERRSNMLWKSSGVRVKEWKFWVELWRESRKVWRL